MVLPIGGGAEGGREFQTKVEVSAVI